MTHITTFPDSSQDPSLYAEQKHIYSLMRSSADGDKLEDINLEKKIAQKAVEKTISILENTSLADKYIPFYKKYLQNHSISKSYNGDEDYAFFDFRIINARLDHFFENGEWTYLFDFNNTAQGWCAMLQPQIKDHATHIAKFLYYKYKRDNDGAPQSLAVVHGRHRDVLAFESIDMGMYAAKTGLYKHVDIYTSTVDFSPSNEGFIVNGKPYDVLVIFGGKTPPLSKNVPYALFPNPECSKSSSYKWDIMEHLSQIKKKFDLPLHFAPSDIGHHHSFTDVVNAFGKKHNLSLVCVKNNMFGSGKGVYFIPLLKPETPEHFQALYHLLQMKNNPERVSNKTFSTVLIQQPLIGGMMKTDALRMADATPRTSLGITTGTVGRLAKSPYNPLYEKAFGKFAHKLAENGSALVEWYNHFVNEKGEIHRNPHELTEEKELVSLLNKYELEYEKLKGMFVVSGARLNPDGSQTVDTDRTYTGCTQRHRQGHYLQGHDFATSIINLYAHTNLLVLAAHESFN